MSVVTLPQYLLPENISANPTVTGTAATSINEVGQWVALVFSMPKTAEISDYMFFINSLVSGCDLEVRIETVNKATGIPTGTLVHANAVASLTITTSGLKTANFPGTFTVASGTLVAYMVKAVGGTPSTIYFGTFTDGVAATGLPHILTYDNTTEQLRSTLCPVMGLGTADNSALQIRHAWTAYQTSSQGYNNSGTNTRGNRMRIDIPCRVAGAKVWLDSDAPSIVKLYDTDGSTVLASATLGAGMPPNAVAYAIEVYFESPVTLAVGQYFLVVEATSATSITMFQFLFNPGKYIASSPFGGDSLVSAQTARVGVQPSGVGSWTIGSFAQYAIIPIIDGIDVATEVGGGETSHVFAA
jgi:hypothetical protein